MRHWSTPLPIKTNPLFVLGKKIVQTLQNAGYTAYFVGGAVRDLYLGAPIKEIDIVTSAKPQQICQLFPQHRLVGVHFGVVLVTLGKVSFDVATFRSDDIYLDGRHPVCVHFSDAREDAERRDFTINGLFYDPMTDQIIDYVNGIQDIEQRRIVCIGEARKRFSEDHLRMLRCIRFFTQLSDYHFSIDPNVLSTITQLSDSLSRVSKERIRLEMQKIFQCSHGIREIELLFQTGLSKNIFPVDQLSPESTLLYPAILPYKKAPLAFVFQYLAIAWNHIQSAKDIEKLQNLFLFTKQEIRVLQDFYALWIHSFHWEQFPLWKKKRSLRGPFTQEILKYLPHWGALYQAKRLDILAQISELYEKEKDFLFPKKLISGQTLIKMGFPPSPLFKRLLEEVENQQLEGNIHNEEEAYQFLTQLLSSGSF